MRKQLRHYYPSCDKQICWAYVGHGQVQQNISVRLNQPNAYGAVHEHQLFTLNFRFLPGIALLVSGPAPIE